MSKLVSKAILNCDIDSLKRAIEGKPNEVFSTLLFDSYEDKRIEELLILEAREIWDNFMKTIEKQVPLLRIIDKRPEQKWIPTEGVSYNEWSYKLSTEGEDKNAEVFRKQVNIFYKEYNKMVASFPAKHIDLSTQQSFSFIYLREHSYKFVYDFKVIEYKYHRIIGRIQTKSCTSGFDGAWKYTISDEPQNIYQRFVYVPFKNNITETDARKFLLNRLCERHALNESMVSQMKKSFEIERFYHRISELASEDARLTREVNAKKEQLNSIIEDISEKKRQLNSLDLKLIGVRNELDVAITHFKQFSIVNELEHECSFEQLSLEEKHLLECKHMHEFYVQNARELEIYKFAFDNMRELSQKLEQEREEFEKERTMRERENECSMHKRESEFNSSIRKREQELESKQAQFDKDCEAYELESTKWKAQQESKFAKYQKQINEYDSLKAKVSTQQNEIQRLKNELSKVTKERDRLKITIETITEYRK